MYVSLRRGEDSLTVSRFDWQFKRNFFFFPPPHIPNNFARTQLASEWQSNCPNQSVWCKRKIERSTLFYLLFIISVKICFCISRRALYPLGRTIEKRISKETRWTLEIDGRFVEFETQGKMDSKQTKSALEENKNKMNSTKKNAEQMKSFEREWTVAFSVSRLFGLLGPADEKRSISLVAFFTVTSTWNLLKPPSSTYIRAEN